jgi:DNA-binding response OmpR family regulator
VLLVDDDPRWRRFVRLMLERAGYRVLHVDRGDRVLALVARTGAELVVLDLKLSEITALTVIRQVRAARLAAGIIVITASTDEADLVDALSTGADDFLTKPFRTRELLARAQSVLRRVRQAAPAHTEPPLHVGSVVLNPANRTVLINGRRVALTRTEADVLTLLMRGAGKTFTVAELLQRLWGDQADQEDVVRTNIYRLRQKLERDPANPEYLCNRPGIGYFFTTSA